MAEHVGGLPVHPVRTARPPVADRGKLPVVAELAVDVVVLPVQDVLCSNVLFAVLTGGAPLMIRFPLRWHSFVVEYFSIAPGTVLSRIILSWHDGGGAQKLEGVAP